MATPGHEKRTRIPWFTMLAVRDVITPQVLEHEYAGRGTQSDPYVVSFLKDDPRDPMCFPLWLRWTMCVAAGYVTFSVAFISSAFSGSIRDISQDFNASPESATLGLSLFLLGFVLGPLLWAPLSELHGRQAILVLTTAAHAALNALASLSPTLAALLTLRLLSGAFGAATLTNSGAVVADLFPPRQRGLAMTVYALVPLFAPVLGPPLGAYVSGVAGWRRVMALMAALSASALAAALLLLPETYAPYLLARRARRLAGMTGLCYVAAGAGAGGNKVNNNDNENNNNNNQEGVGGQQRPPSSDSVTVAATLSRPFVLAAHEPIVGLVALYQAVVFGTLYFMFAALPLVYTEILGWPREQSGLSFLGVVAGMSLSVVFALWDNARYVRALERLPRGQAVPPESRLPACCLGGACVVVGLLWCAWTARPGLHWLVNMASGVPFGFGIVLVTIGSTNYLVDVYTVHAASTLTVCICGRAVWGALFPLFVRGMFASLGAQWSLAIPAVLSLVCLPVPFVFYRNGPTIRARCKYAGEALGRVQRARRPVDEETPLLM